MKIQSSGLALSVWGEGTFDLANMIQDNFENKKHQEFMLKKNKLGSYEIKNVNSGKCLQPEGTSVKMGVNVLQVFIFK